MKVSSINSFTWRSSVHIWNSPNIKVADLSGDTLPLKRVFIKLLKVNLIRKAGIRDVFSLFQTGCSSDQQILMCRRCRSNPCVLLLLRWKIYGLKGDLEVTFSTKVKGWVSFSFSCPACRFEPVELYVFLSALLFCFYINSVHPAAVPSWQAVL